MQANLGPCMALSLYCDTCRGHYGAAECPKTHDSQRVYMPKEVDAMGVMYS